MSTTDRELLELAAKAAGYEIDVTHLPEASGAWWIQLVQERRRVWNPLTDDGDALRLAVKLGMLVEVNLCGPFTDAITTKPIKRENGITTAGLGEWHEDHEGDANAATRRAIVRAAAALAPAGNQP